MVTSWISVTRGKKNGLLERAERSRQEIEHEIYKSETQFQGMVSTNRREKAASKGLEGKVIAETTRKNDSHRKSIQTSTPNMRGGPNLVLEATLWKITHQGKSNHQQWGKKFGRVSPCKL